MTRIVLILVIALPGCWPAPASIEPAKSARVVMACGHCHTLFDCHECPGAECGDYDDNGNGVCLWGDP